MLLSALLILALCGCGTDKENEMNEPSNSEVFIKNKDIVLSSEENNITISFYTNKEWNITAENGENDKWWNISKESGNSGNNDIILTVNANNTPEKRRLSLKITAGSAFDIINIEQSPQNVLLIDKKEYSISEEGDTIAIDINSNIKYELIIPGEYDWIKKIESPINRGLENSTLYLNILPNTTFGNRKADIYIQSKECKIKDTILIVQNTVPIKEISNTPGNLLNNIGGVDSVVAIKKLKLLGNINSSDIAVIRTLKNLWYLDINEVSLSIGGNNYGNNPDCILSDEYGEVNGMSMFSNMKNLKTVIWSKHIDIINNATFQNCELLDSIFIPDNVKEIRTYAFEYCRNLKNITLPNFIYEIGHGAFGSSGIERIKFPDSLKKIGNLAFRGSGLISINIPSSLEEIGSKCFAGCRNLKKAYINDGIKYITDECFYMCVELEIIYIPESIESIGREAFSNCPNIKEIYMYGDKDKLKYYGDWIFSGDEVYKNAILYIKKGTSKNDWYMTPFFNFVNVKAIL